MAIIEFVDRDIEAKKIDKKKKENLNPKDTKTEDKASVKA